MKCFFFRDFFVHLHREVLLVLLLFIGFHISMVRCDSAPKSFSRLTLTGLRETKKNSIWRRKLNLGNLPLKI